MTAEGEAIEPEPLAPLALLYQDSDFVCVDKPAGLLVHPSKLAPDRDTVMTRLRDQLGQYVWPVHRLDRGTSGALFFALSSEAASVLHTAIETSAQKTYWALVRGSYAGPAELTYAIAKDEGSLDRVLATTALSRLEDYGWASLVEAKPKTGRFHQIRRHLAHLRYPLANDTNYGTGWFNRKVRADLGLMRLGLHAKKISIVLPDGRELQAESPLPEDYARALDRLRSAQ
jgi:tRNA pseudouridine65 synthase